MSSWYRKTSARKELGYDEMMASQKRIEDVMHLEDPIDKLVGIVDFFPQNEVRNFVVFLNCFSSAITELYKKYYIGGKLNDWIENEIGIPLQASDWVKLDAAVKQLPTFRVKLKKRGKRS